VPASGPSFALADEGSPDAASDAGGTSFAAPGVVNDEELQAVKKTKPEKRYSRFMPSYRRELWDVA
jgi:hypothetical protein